MILINLLSRLFIINERQMETISLQSDTKAGNPLYSEEEQVVMWCRTPDD